MASFAESISARLAWVSLRVASRIALRRIDLRVEGLDHLPRHGPAILAARHFHHLWDGCALIATLPRPMRVVVALDWLQHPLARRMMVAACQFAGWPVVSRPPWQGRLLSPRDQARHDARDWSQLVAATRQSVDLLNAGRLLLVFPEGHPTIDPHSTPKTDDDEFLPFQPGFLRFARLAERTGSEPVPIIPVGLEYHRGARWRVTVRFGAPMRFDAGVAAAARIEAIEQRVRQLSGVADFAE